MRIKFLLVLLFAVLFAVMPTHAQTKRALLIGINTYQPKGTHVAHNPSSDEGRFALPQFEDLDGALNDVKSMQALLTSPKFGFPSDPDHMHVLAESEATRAGILAAMQKYLVDEPARGDTVVFFYAGHGSLRVNSLSEKREYVMNGKPMHLDNTIVPADAYLGTVDVRDREISRIFNASLDKGIHLTAIFDSCHSGSVARGLPLGTVGKSRYLAYDPRDIHEAPDAARDGKEVVAPEDRTDNAALVFSATQPDQLAKEATGSTEAHGAFTMALVQALQVLPANTPAADVYKRVEVVLEGSGVADEDPMLDGTGARKAQPLFGGEASPGKLRAAALSTDDDGSVVLDIGPIANIGTGSEFVSMVPDKQGRKIRVRVEEARGITRSAASVVTPPGAKVETGEIFELDKWMPAQTSALRVWTAPATFAQAQLASMVAEIKSAAQAKNISIVEDPVVEAPTHMLTWDGKQWILERAGSAETDQLGAELKAAAVTGKVPSGAHLWINLPPSKELMAQLKLNDPQSAVQTVSDKASAVYMLAGTWSDSGVSYSWMKRADLEAAATNSTAHSQTGVCSGSSPYPMRSDWVTIGGPADVDSAAQVLSDLAARLSKLHGWLQLQSAASGDDPYPYHLVLKNLSDGTVVADSRTVQGESYQLVLQAQGEVDRAAQPRWVYVLGIDCRGRGQLLYPRTGGENKFPNDAGRPSAIPLPGVRIKIGPPLGLDTYILLTTATPLPDPGILEFQGAATRSAHAGPPNPLEQLLGSASSGTRAAEVEMPTDWSIQYLHAQSVPKPQTP